MTDLSFLLTEILREEIRKYIGVVQIDPLTQNYIVVNTLIEMDAVLDSGGAKGAICCVMETGHLYVDGNQIN